MRAFAWFVGALLFTGIVGGALAYPAYELTSTFANFPFHRVAGRIAMLVLAAALVWLCVHLHLTSKRDLGYGLPRRRFIAISLLFATIGMATAGIGAAFLLLTHLRVGAPDFIPGVAGFARIFLVGVASGFSVALLEETVFRGFLHTAIERESGPWAAVLLTAPLFAVLHFVAKVRIPADQLSWGSGFDLLLRSFAPLGTPALVADAFLSWLIVGLDLELDPCLDRQYRSRHRSARRMGDRAAHAAGSHHERQLAGLRGLGRPLRRTVGLLAAAVGRGHRRGTLGHSRSVGAVGASGLRMSSR